MSAPNLYYSITNPNTKEKIFPKTTAVWAYSREQYLKHVEENKLWWGVDGTAKMPRLKTFLSEADDVVPRSIWLYSDVGHTQEATSEFLDLFPDGGFNSPKPSRLIRRVLEIATDENTIILDSFAGSGTTAQAVMDLNKEDGGNRKYILVQMSEASPAEPEKNICKDITRERVKRAIKKFEYNSGFEYLRVGVSMDAESLLSGNLPNVESFGSYIFYLCTGEKTSKPVKSVAKNLYLVGSQGNTDIYLIYSQDYDELTRLALNLEVAEKITTAKKKRTIVYAPACFLDEDYLRAKQIEFVNIPYGLFQRKGNES